MANGGGLMSIAASENLNPLEKFALGFLGTAEQNQRKRYEEEAKFVREKTSQIQERVTKQRGLYSGLKAKKQQQITELRSVMPGLSDATVSSIVRSGDDTVQRLVKAAMEDQKVNAGKANLGKFLKIPDAQGNMIEGDASIYQKREGTAADKLVSRMFRKPKRQAIEKRNQDFGQSVASFFGAATPASDLLRDAQIRAMDLSGYDSSLSGDAMDARMGLDQYFAAGGTAEALQRKTGGLTFAFGTPAKQADTSIAQEVVQTTRQDLMSKGPDKLKSLKDAAKQAEENPDMDPVAVAAARRARDDAELFTREYDVITNIQNELVQTLDEAVTNNRLKQFAQYWTGVAKDKEGNRIFPPTTLDASLVEQLIKNITLKKSLARRAEMMTGLQTPTPKD